MPSIVTHHYFAKDVLKNINNKEKIANKIFYIFAQSFDNLFYYKFFTPWKGKKIRELGSIAQRKNINFYFQNILDYITENDLEENQELISYLYGSICHYVLDSYCHPFIIYYTGDPKMNIKYRGMHEQMEVNIDAYIYEKKTEKKLKSASIADTLLPKIDFSNNLKKALDFVFKKTFNIQNVGQIYNKSILTGNFILKHFVTDKSGLKKKLYTFKDFIMFKSKRKYQYLSFNVSKINYNYLNLQHHQWFYPANDQIIKNDSFEELYIKALNKATFIINNINNYFNHEITRNEILNIIGNFSYVTGLPENYKVKNLKFKF